MDSFEFNKIAAGVLVSLLVAMVGSLVSESVVHPKKLTQNVLGITVERKADAGGSAEKKELAPITPLLVSANIEKGKEISKKCTQCHTFEEGGPAKLGPNLWNIVGAKFAHAAGFAYSAVFKGREETWTVENLNKYIHKPKEFMPGTKMTFVGLPKDQDRADLIAYLNTLSKNPQPLPTS